MTNSQEYYQKYYRYFYNYQAIKNHMIEKKIYSPSDFRYYCHQMIKELNEKSSKSNHTITNAYTSSNKNLNELEKLYILSSINFLFNIDDQKTNSIFLPDISNLKKLITSFSSDLVNIVSKASTHSNQRTKDITRLRKLMYLIDNDDIVNGFIKEFERKYSPDLGVSSPLRP